MRSVTRLHFLEMFCPFLCKKGDKRPIKTQLSHQHLMTSDYTSFLSEYSVPLERISETQLTLCHPERELLPLVLAHCQYTLKKGEETDSSYDLPGIQTELARRFLAGKPLIKAVGI